MSFTSNQIIIVGLVGLATAIGVASATIQSGSIERARPLTESPTSASNSISGVPTNKPESKKSEPQPAKTPAVESSLVTRASQQKVAPLVVTPPNSDCKISMAVVNDPNPPLNVRSNPQINGSKIVGKLPNNTFVSVAEEQNGWLRISDPVSGWVAKNRTDSSCATVKHQINFPPGGNEAIVKGRIIGGGTHSYTIRVTKGQTLTVKNRKDVFPSIFTPNGKLLAGDPNTQGNQTEWTGKMPVTGNYTFQLDSNFRGYEYEFSVQVR
ncbi:MAG: SH3 domain-containing protein [Microcoleus sp. CSU_2_2]|nr:SH3 domain-containing protein [Microcoleus sp. SU_5_3]NJS13207.1 SH3 domain-containing protein [Microcoleus sp. CSU_2_2]